jgi:tRNA threonylcarbamoyladenosine biosynthesis protein TsaE
VYHLDAYRVAGVEDFEAIGFAELLEQGGVVVVEWADRVAGLIPANHIRVTIEPVAEGRRRIEVGRERA